MKKIVAALMTGIILSGAAVTTASAQAHEVQPGENLWDIAKEYDTSIDELVHINDLKTTVIQPKQILNIHDTYVVQRGDTLISIGKEYDVSVNDLKKWNDLKTSLIVIGQELQIKGKKVDKEDRVIPQAQTTEAPAKKEKAETLAKQEAKPASKTAAAEEKPQGNTISVSATAYTADCEGCSGVTYTGVDLNKNPNAKVIAVDPNVIPLGSEVYVEGYGYAIAADIGSAIKGNKIDLHVPSKSEAVNWGVRTVDVTIVE